MKSPRRWRWLSAGPGRCGSGAPVSCSHSSSPDAAPRIRQRRQYHWMHLRACFHGVDLNGGRGHSTARPWRPPEDGVHHRDGPEIQRRLVAGLRRVGRAQCHLLESYLDTGVSGHKAGRPGVEGLARCSRWRGTGIVGVPARGAAANSSNNFRSVPSRQRSSWPAPANRPFSPGVRAAGQTTRTYPPPDRSR